MKICPRCGSTNVDWIIPQNWSVWECKDCDYTGPIIEGNKRIAEEIRKDYEAKLKKEKARNKKLTKNDKENKEEEKDREKRKKEKIEEKREIEEDLTDEEIDRRLEALDI